MKKNVLKRYVYLSVISTSFLLAGCSNGSDEVIAQKTKTDENISILTRAPGGFHWGCRNKDCLFPLNGGWQNYCSQCQQEYSMIGGEAFLSLLLLQDHIVAFDYGGGGYVPDDKNRIQLVGYIFVPEPPPAWYESNVAQRYIEELRSSMQYWNYDWAEGVEWGWYRTVRVLYPQYHAKYRVQREYERWLINEARYMTEPNASAIKAGIKAGIDAFMAY